MYNVMVPVDGSEDALGGVRHAIRIAASRSDARLWLVNVQPHLPRYVGRFVSRRDAVEMRLERGRAALQEARALVEAAGLSCRSIVLRGDTARAIARFAAEERIDQIVLGTSRASPLVRFLTGSTANRLLEVADVPVALIAGKRPGKLQRYGLPAGVGAGLAALLLAAE